MNVYINCQIRCQFYDFRCDLAWRQSSRTFHSKGKVSRCDPVLVTGCFWLTLSSWLYSTTDVLLGNARAEIVVSWKRNLCGKATEDYFWTQDRTTLVLRISFFLRSCIHACIYIYIYVYLYTHTLIFTYICISYKYMLHEPKLGSPVCAGSIFQSQGHCQKGNECTFAHGHEELESFLATTSEA